MESDLHHHHHHQNQQSLNSGLMRYRSAPSTLLANFVGSSEAEVCDDFLQPRSSSPEAESMFARFMSCGGNSDSVPHHLRERREKSPACAGINHRNSMFMPSIEQETEIIPEQNGYSHSSQLIYQTPPPQPPIHSSAAMESSFRAMNSVAMDNQPQLKPISGNCSNLIRHSSSPAGLFSNLSVDNGYAVFRGMGNFRGVNGEAAPSTSRFKDRMNFSSETPSSSALISQISEIDSESIDATSPDKGSLGNGNGGNRCYIPGFPIGSWDDSSIASDDFSGIKRAKLSSGLNSLETQNGEITGNRAPGLTHHFSLPKTSAEMATIEKLLQFQDSVPCKIRAKRGCATHPRSIAERVRRTRISERMRKLQELVPNMDKQTNTADMLDLAVDYIKDLQKQVTTLTDNRANCTCSIK